jgi:tetratricopeptide (TPR) repeat protein
VETPKVIKYLVTACCLLALAGCASANAVPPGKSTKGQAAKEHAFSHALAQGKAALAAKDYQDAYRMFSRAIKLNPANPAGYEGRGTTDYYLGSTSRTYFKQMHADFAQAVRLRSKRSKTTLALDYYNLGLSELLLGHLYHATEDEAVAIQLNHNLIAAYAVAGTAYTYLGSQKHGSIPLYLKKAVQMYNEVVKQDPTDPRGYVNLGIAYANLHTYSAAYKQFTRAILLDPQDAVPWFNRGLVLKEWHKPKRALHDFRKALQFAKNPQLRATLHKLIQEVQ